jgi:hypothetical protein
MALVLAAGVALADARRKALLRKVAALPSQQSAAAATVSPCRRDRLLAQLGIRAVGVPCSRVRSRSVCVKSTSAFCRGAYMGFMTKAWTVELDRAGVARRQRAQPGREIYRRTAGL